MPQFAFLCRDKPDALPLRMEVRPAHLEYVQSFGNRLLLAGPMLDGDANPIGSLIIVEAEDEAEARKIAANDPYAKAGLFADVGVVPFKAVIANFPKE